MYMASYPTQDLAGLNPFKHLKKMHKKTKKIVKKAAPIVAHAAAAYFTGGASLQLTAQMQQKKKAKKAAAKEAARLKKEQAMLQAQLGPSVAPSSSVSSIRSLAPSYESVASQFSPTVPPGYQGGSPSLEPGFFAPGGEGDPSVSQEKLPAWALPAGIGAAGLLLLLSRRKRGR